MDLQLASFLERLQLMDVKALEMLKASFLSFLINR